MQLFRPVPGQPPAALHLWNGPCLNRSGLSPHFLGCSCLRARAAVTEHLFLLRAENGCKCKEGRLVGELQGTQKCSLTLMPQRRLGAGDDTALHDTTGLKGRSRGAETTPLGTDACKPRGVTLGDTFLYDDGLENG